MLKVAVGEASLVLNKLLWILSTFLKSWEKNAKFIFIWRSFSCNKTLPTLELQANQLVTDFEKQEMLKIKTQDDVLQRKNLLSLPRAFSSQISYAFVTGCQHFLYFCKSTNKINEN